MIEAKDLRIGNWYNDIMAGSVMVRGIDLANWEAVNSTPIPLTPEILEKCGFKKFQGMWSTNGIKGFVLRPEKEGEYVALFNQSTQKFLYVHQLENLYYALTGEELKIEI